MPLAFVCDFDGTVAPVDIGARFIHRFDRGGAAAIGVALERWRRGEIGHRELTRVECQALAVTAEEAAAFGEGFSLDPSFGGFVEAATRAGHHVEIASEGFDFYIGALLHREGLGAVPFTANRLRFQDGRVRPEFPHAGGCGACGNCKGARVGEARRRAGTVVFVGDGFSDRCGARAADRVMARDDLLDWCRAEALPVEPFVGFAELARRL